MARSSTVRAAADSLILPQNARAACRWRQNSSQRAVRPSGVSPSQAANRSSHARPAAGPSICAEPIQAEPRHQRQGRLVALGQPIAQHRVGQLEQQRAGLGPVEHAKTRVEPGLDGVGPQQRPAKGVDGADARGIQVADQLQPIAGLVLGDTPAGGGGRPPECGPAFRGRHAR